MLTDLLRELRGFTPKGSCLRRWAGSPLLRGAPLTSQPLSFFQIEKYQPDTNLPSHPPESHVRNSTHTVWRRRMGLPHRVERFLPYSLSLPRRSAIPCSVLALGTFKDPRPGPSRWGADHLELRLSERRDSNAFAFCGPREITRSLPRPGRRTLHSLQGTRSLGVLLPR